MPKTNHVQFTVYLLIFAALGLALSACGPRFPENLHETPHEYYLFVPEQYELGGDYYLFVALHAKGDDGADCYNDWYLYAREVRFFLLCPTMPIVDGAYDVAQSEAILAAILSDVYSQYRLGGQFFVAGHAEGADFAMGYAYRYPSAILGLSAIAPSILPSTAQASNIPALLLVGNRDQAARAAADAFYETLFNAGFSLRLIEVPGVESSLKADARRISAELFRDLTY